MKALNVNVIVLISMLFIAASSIRAVVELPFSSWEGLTKVSPDIVIVRCDQTPNPDRDRGAGPTGALVNSEIQVIYILKGQKASDVANRLGKSKLGISRLTSEFYPFQGNFYLIFSVLHDGTYQATESYRVIPLGLNFNTNSLSQKTLEQQIQMLLQKRLGDLNRQMHIDQEEMQILKQALNK